MDATGHDCLKIVWRPDALAACPNEKGLQMQAFSEAADGIRTHELLHGKQDPTRRRFAGSPCNECFCRREARLTIPGFRREITGVRGLKAD
jgi:hypothetical protein